MLAASHNANALCSRCGRPVRSPVRIADDVAEARRLALPIFRSCRPDDPDHAVLADQATIRLRLLGQHLAAELAGDHAVCSHPLTVADLELEDLALRLELHAPPRALFRDAMFVSVH